MIAAPLQTCVMSLEVGRVMVVVVVVVVMDIVLARGGEGKERAGPREGDTTLDVADGEVGGALWPWTTRPHRSLKLSGTTQRTPSAREVLNLSSIFRSGPVVCGETISCEERDVALRHFLGALPVLPVGGAWLKAFPWRKGILSRKLRPPRRLQAPQQG